MPYTLKETINAFAEACGCDETAAEKMHQQARNLYQRGAIRPEAEVGRGKVARYSLESVAALYLMLILYDVVGVAVSDLRPLFANFHSEPGYSGSPNGLTAFIQATRRGEDWWFGANFGGTRGLSGAFFRADNPPPIKSLEILDIVARVTVPASRLIRPVLALPLFNEAED